MSAQKIRGILADVLGVDIEAVVPEANITNDLAAESIDYIDIAFSLEQAFGFKVNPGDIFPAFMRDIQIFGEDGAMLPTVRKRLADEYPHIQPAVIDAFKKDPAAFFTVNTIISFIEGRLKAR